MIEAPGVVAEGHRTSLNVFAVIRPLSCPVCEKEMQPADAGDSRWLPFCSERCRNVDLYRWSMGRYAIVEPLEPSEEDEFGETGEPKREG